MSLLPENKKRNVEVSKKRKLWIYGASFVGKSTLVDNFPDLLIISTDGNVSTSPNPYVIIKDEVTQNGREINRKFAWEVFKEVITELELKNNTFKSISIDVVDDLREMCRVYMYDKLGIQHESDAGYGKGYDMIKNEFLSTMRRFFNLNYDNLIIVSHEDVSKTITKRDGTQITRIAPNIQEGLAIALAGFVDLVGRAIAYTDTDRVLSFKTDNVIFGGGRLGVSGREIPLNYDELMKIYTEASTQSTIEVATNERKPRN